MEKITLENGVRILVEEMKGIRSVAFGIFVKNGSRNETEKENGISHFIEHMLFKGTGSRTAACIAKEMDIAGGQLNAYTTKEYTCFYTRVLDESFENAVDILSDMYFNSLFDNEEIAKERNVIFEEINMYEDTPEDLVYEQLQSEIWKNHPLGRPILGTKESISHFTTKDIKKYVSEHYRPDNTVIAVAGNIEAQKAADIIGKYFSEYKIGGSKDIITAPVYTPCSITRKKDIEQQHICMIYKSLPTGHENSYDLAALNTLLGGGMSSVLFRKIREETGLAYTVYTFNTSYSDTGMFAVYMGLSPQNGEKAPKIVREELEKIKKGNISDEIIKNTKLQLKNNYLLGLESTASVMANMGRSMILTDKVLTTRQVEEKTDRVSKESIVALANKIFDFSKESISIVTNK